jgi:amino acid transporter
VTHPAGGGLVRTVRRWDLVALTINAIVGAGIFGLPSEVFARTGAYSLLAFLACAAAVSLVILCFAEVSSRFSGTGGPYLYARAAFGPVVAFEVGWMMWVARLTAFAANCNLLIAYFSYFVPAAGSGSLRAATIALVVVGLTLVNVVGVRDATNLNNVLTVAKLVPLVLLVLAGGFALDLQRFAATAPLTFGDFSVSVLLLVYAFTGFEMATIPGGELRDPQRDLPRALLTSIAAVAVLYVAIQVVAIGTVPGLAHATRPLADAGRQVFGPAGAALISAGAVVSILGNLNVTLLVAPRIPFAMAERHEVPRLLGALHPRFRTPYVSILVTAAIVLVLTLTGTFVYAATISVIARLVGYLATCAALPALRRGAGDSPFVAPGGLAAAIAAIALVLWLLSNSTGRQARDAVIAAAVGLAIYGLARSGAGPSPHRVDSIAPV